MIFDRRLERGLREDRGLKRRQARKIARQLQARGQVSNYHGWCDEDVDALLQKDDSTPELSARTDKHT